MTHEPTETETDGSPAESTNSESVTSPDAPEQNTNNEYAPEWELPTDDAGEPDREAALEQIGLEYDRLFNIDTVGGGVRIS